MKTRLLVLVPADSPEPEEAVRAAMEPFRLDEDDEASIRSRHWDGWTSESEEGIRPVPLRTLPEADLPGGVITPDGRWRDLEDHGWRMMRGDSAANHSALEAWRQEYLHIRNRWPDSLAAMVIARS